VRLSLTPFSLLQRPLRLPFSFSSPHKQPQEHGIQLRALAFFAIWSTSALCLRLRRAGGRVAQWDGPGSSLHALFEHDDSPCTYRHRPRRRARRGGAQDAPPRATLLSPSFRTVGQRHSPRHPQRQRPACLLAPPPNLSPLAHRHSPSIYSSSPRPPIPPRPSCPRGLRARGYTRPRG
jgi:hypothetical protein